MTIVSNDIAQEKKWDAFNIDWSDFFNRWKKARVSALKKVLSRDLDLPLQIEDEDELLSQLADCLNDCTPAQAENIKELLLRAIFDFSRALALSLSKHHKIGLQLADFRELLTVSKIPCMQGSWQTRESSEVLTRKGCNVCLALQSFACDYYREAIDGLVMGLGEQERFVRHACKRRGDEQCVDVFFLENHQNKAAGINWAKIPDQKLQELLAIVTAFQKETRVNIELKGYKEGVLHYMIKGATDDHCSGGGSITKKFSDVVNKVFPDLKLKDVTPKAVLGVES